MSMFIQMMTTQGRICVQCVANGLDGDSLWPITVMYTVLETCIHVPCVISVFPLRDIWINIRMPTAVNTSALNVESVSRAFTLWQHTDEFIRERNRLNVLFAANDLQYQVTLWNTVELTVERNCTNATCVKKSLFSLGICRNTWESTRLTNLTSVSCVTKFSADSAVGKHINVMLTARKDRMTITVLTGENCFKFNVELNRHVGSHTGAKPYSCRVVIITENYQQLLKTIPNPTEPYPQS